MITSITPCGPLVSACSLPGEQKSDGVFPAHPSGLPLSRNRWLLLIATRALRCHDDDHSIIYQLREGSPDGRLLKEGFLRRVVDGWDVLGDGVKYVQLSRHPMGFGVPKGAIVGGTCAAHGNIFAAVWSLQASGPLDPATGTYAHNGEVTRRAAEVVGVEWCQFRLNEAEDDIEIIQPPRKLCQRGMEGCPELCSLPGARHMIQSLVPPVPFNVDATEWAMTNHFNAGLAALKFRFNPALGLYEWVETGPALPREDDRYIYSEANLAKAGGRWIINVRARRKNAATVPDWAGGLARDRGDTGWVTTQDPFLHMPPPSVVQDPNRQAPATVFTGPDGVLRLLSGDFTNSPHPQRRDPLYIWDVDPERFIVSDRRVVIDTVAAGIFPADATPRSTCFGHFFPHMGGRTQLLAHRLMCFRYRPGVEPKGPPVTPEQFARFGIYYSRVEYDRDYPAAWSFA